MLSSDFIFLLPSPSKLCLQKCNFSHVSLFISPKIIHLTTVPYGVVYRHVINPICWQYFAKTAG